jgi:putative chitinase
MTLDELQKCTGASVKDATRLLPFIVDAMEEFEINTPRRQAMFLAQVGHESGGLHYLKEIWGPTDAQRRYEGRLDLGNTEVGDGSRYRGRGLIQITGRSNYAAASEGLGEDFLNSPELLEDPSYAVRSAAWFWEQRGLNEIADAGDFKKVTKRINGGYNGYDERVALYTKAQEVLV